MDDHPTDSNDVHTAAPEVILTPADFSAMRAAPSGHLLNDLEIELCLRLRMFPEHYLGIKEAIVREACRNGTITKEGIRRTVWVSVFIVSNFVLLKLFMRSWIMHRMKRFLISS
jgi:hypothetical protein